MRRPSLITGLALAAALTAAVPAHADVSPHCQVGAYCLFPGENFIGDRAVPPLERGCHPVSALGFTTARSAARGFGDSWALELFADGGCATKVATVWQEVPVTAALSYRLTQIPY
ncbi:hypothetical protein [Saccharothrix syringae]|uniref:Peptidase inhibitor family I36 n=1 Tax=Saccharothrix syringae TaxID=103733 RepID=A0A5Q0H9V9_SACSY|nr:hypothetical protein [Saccharothrix syringae]QFZ23027.1 hypothetical protein EKG83_41335 [Saccharothrix syringae]